MRSENRSKENEDSAFIKLGRSEKADKWLEKDR